MDGSVNKVAIAMIMLYKKPPQNSVSENNCYLSSWIQRWIVAWLIQSGLGWRLCFTLKVCSLDEIAALLVPHSTQFSKLDGQPARSTTQGLL